MAGTTLGVFADGPVGEAVVSTIVERCADALSYVVVPSGDSAGAVRGGRDLRVCPMLSWAEAEAAPALPRHGDGVPDVVLLAWWPHLVDASFLRSGQRATLNMHPSLLPFGRGKDPNFWALADSEPFGVTIHHVDEGVDTGDVAFQTAVPTGWEDTGSTLYLRAQAALVDLFSTSLDEILSLSLPRISQDRARATFHRRAELAPRSRLTLDAPTTCRQLLNVLRARTFWPHPACRFTDETGTYQVRVHIEKVGEPR